MNDHLRRQLGAGGNLKTSLPIQGAGAKSSGNRRRSQVCVSKSGKARDSSPLNVWSRWWKVISSVGEAGAGRRGGRADSSVKKQNDNCACGNCPNESSSSV